MTGLSNMLYNEKVTNDLFFVSRNLILRVDERSFRILTFISEN